MLFFVGLFGVALAGAVALVPFGFEDGAQESEEPNSDDGNAESVSDLLPADEADEIALTSEASTVALALLAAPDFVDEVYGQLGSDTLIGGGKDDPTNGTHAVTTSSIGTDEDDADLIFGGEDEDTFVLGAAGMGLGGAEGDVFAMGPYEGTQVVPVIKDFNPAEDEIQLLYDAGEGVTGGMTTVADGTDLIVQLDGASVARLEGLSSIDMSLIKLVPLPTA